MCTEFLYWNLALLYTCRQYICVFIHYGIYRNFMYFFLLHAAYLTLRGRPCEKKNACIKARVLLVRHQYTWSKKRSPAWYVCSFKLTQISSYSRADVFDPVHCTLVDTLIKMTPYSQKSFSSSNLHVFVWGLSHVWCMLFLTPSHEWTALCQPWNRGHGLDPQLITDEQYWLTFESLSVNL